MKQLIIAILCLIAFTQCKKATTETTSKETQKMEKQAPPPTSFEREALQQKVQTLAGKEESLQDVFNSLKGKTVLVDIWASWCKDCRASMPKMKELKAKYGEKVVFLYLSMDKDTETWTKFVQENDFKGTHFYIGDQWKTGFCQSINLNWIPRFMVVGKDGSIRLYNAKTAKDSRIVETLDADLAR